MKSISTDDLSVKRSELAKLTREELEGLTIVALRKKATGVVSGIAEKEWVRTKL